MFFFFLRGAGGFELWDGTKGWLTQSCHTLEREQFVIARDLCFLWNCSWWGFLGGVYLAQTCIKFDLKAKIMIIWQAVLREPKEETAVLKKLSICWVNNDGGVSWEIYC